MQLLKQQIKQIKQETYTLYYACKDPRISWQVRLLAMLVVAYAFSPIDLIPDFIPILGYLDDLILIPIGIALVLKLIPKNIINDAREKARIAIASGASKPKNWIAAGAIIFLWLGCVILVIGSIMRK